MLGYETVVYEACNELGGIPQMGIPRYRLPKEILDKEIEDILALGVEVQTGCRIGNDLQFADLLSHDAVLLATGAHRPAKMTIPTETSANVYQGLDFLAQYNLGQTLDLGKRVIVIGGGNVAIDVSRTLIRLGCTPVLLYRRTRNQMPAHDEEVCDAQEEGLECQYLLAPTSIGPSRQGGIILECNKMKLEGKGPDGRQQVVSLEGETETFEADQIILATGEVPDLSYLPDEVELAKGLLGVNEAGQTRIANVFGAGDMIDQPWTVAQAIGSAKRAAIAIDHYLRGDDLQAILNQGALAKTMRAHLGIEVSSKSDDQQIATYKDLNMTYSGTQPSHTSNKLPPAERSGSFDEVDPGLDEKAALEEAQRCLSCGVCRMCGNCNLFCPDGAVKLDSGGKRYVIDYDYCKGCGICFNECPVACIALDREGEG